jgi:transposase-like protein
MADAAAPFVPPHCPRSDCRFHRCAEGWRFVRHGSFTRDAAPRRIPRFRCGHCGHTFSSQTFSPSYWLKRSDVLLAAAFRLLACSGHRQIAREARCHHTTVMRHAARLGRHALLYLRAHGPQGPLTEPVVGDGFESFAYSHYHPLYLNLIVGAVSHFCHAFSFTELRRKGRMTLQQKRRRAQLEARWGRPDPRGIEHGMAVALKLAAPEPQALVLRTDAHADYPRALRHPSLRGYAIHHQCTSSREARTARNPLFPVNRFDLLLRHNSANHKRETIAFSKLNQGVIERAAWLLVWLNFTKPFSERHGGGTPAMRLELSERSIPIRDILSRRLFASRVELPAEWARYYWGEVPTRRIPNARRHRLKFAA